MEVVIHLQTCYLTGMNLTAQLSLLTPDKEANTCMWEQLVAEVA